MCEWQWQEKCHLLMFTPWYKLTYVHDYMQMRKQQEQHWFGMSCSEVQILMLQYKKIMWSFQLICHCASLTVRSSTFTFWPFHSEVWHLYAWLLTQTAWVWQLSSCVVEQNWTPWIMWDCNCVGRKYNFAGSACNKIQDCRGETFFP